MNKANQVETSNFAHHLCCNICRGLLIDATMIKECMHSFCRSCIVGALANSSDWKCPVPSCKKVLNKSRMKQEIRANQKLQDIVYTLFPEVYNREMQRRRDFYLANEDCLKRTIQMFPQEGPYTLEQALGVERYESRTKCSGKFKQVMLSYKNSEKNYPDPAVQNSISAARDMAMRRYVNPVLLKCSEAMPFSGLKEYLASKVGTEAAYIRILFDDVYPVHPSLSIGDAPEVFIWKRTGEAMPFEWDIVADNNDMCKVPVFEQPVVEIDDEEDDGDEEVRF